MSRTEDLIRTEGQARRSKAYRNSESVIAATVFMNHGG